MRGSKTKFPGEVEVYFYFITGGGGDSRPIFLNLTMNQVKFRSLIFFGGGG